MPSFVESDDVHDVENMSPQTIISHLVVPDAHLNVVYIILQVDGIKLICIYILYIYSLQYICELFRKLRVSPHRAVM